MAIASVGDIVSYKGKNYRLRWAGTTKFGQKAKLSFLDGSREFWVDLALIGPGTSTTSTRSRGGRGKCENCGERAHCCTSPGCNCGGYDCLS